MLLKKEILNTAEYRRNYFLEESRQISIRNKALNLYTPNSMLDFFATWGENIEPELLDWIDSLPSQSTFFDIGASNGFFALYAHLAGLEVTAFEPDALNYCALEINRFLNKADFGSFNIALTDHTHIGELYINTFGFGMHNKVLDEKANRDGIPEAAIEHIQKVISFALDDFVQIFKIAPPRFIKIDVDGSEMKVLQGAGTLLSNVEQLFIELSDLRPDYTVIRQAIENLGLRLQQQFPVRHHKGGHYQGLYNYIFKRG